MQAANVHIVSFFNVNDKPLYGRLITLVQDRQGEINSLINAIKTNRKRKFVSHEKPYRQQRRRTKSFSSYKIPVQIRCRIKTNVFRKTKNVSYRRHKRRLRLLRESKAKAIINEACDGSDDVVDSTSKNIKHRWLPTHLWHVKRMKMKRLWGWMIPYQHNSRGIK